MSERAPYSRVYWAIVDDPRFEAIYDDDHHLATWLRLLISADALWPASCPLPRYARKVSVAALTDVGLIDVSGQRFRIHGLDAERGRRRDAAQRVPKRDPTGTQLGLESQPERVVRPGPKPSYTETRRANAGARVGPNTVDRDPHLRELRAAIEKQEKEN